MKNAKGKNPDIKQAMNLMKKKNFQLGLEMGRPSIISLGITEIGSHRRKHGSDHSQSSNSSRRSSVRSYTTRSWRENLEPRQKKKQRIYRRKIGKWNPGELAKRIAQDHDIPNLVREKIILSDPKLHFDMMNGPTRLSLPRQEEYLKKHPIELEGLGYSNTSYKKLVDIEEEERRQKQIADAGKVMQNLEKFPLDMQKRSLSLMKKYQPTSHVLTQSMLDKKNEQRFYKQLERQFKQMKREEYTQSKKIAAIQLQMQSDSVPMLSENSIFIDNQEVTLKEPKLSTVTSDLDMFQVDNDSTNGYTRTENSIYIDGVPQPGKVAPSDMSFQIRKLSKEIRQQQRKKLEAISLNDQLLGFESRNQSVTFDFPSLVQKLKERKEPVVKLDTVQLPMLHNAQSQSILTGQTSKLDQSFDNISYKDYIGPFSNKKDSLSRLKQDGRGFNKVMSQSISYDISPKNSVVQPRSGITSGAKHDRNKSTVLKQQRHLDWQLMNQYNYN